MVQNPVGWWVGGLVGGYSVCVYICEVCVDVLSLCASARATRYVFVSVDNSINSRSVNSRSINNRSVNSTLCLHKWPFVSVCIVPVRFTFSVK